MRWKYVMRCWMSGNLRRTDKAIINLPSTVQLSMPHVYASQVEYMSENLKYRENVILSLHPHNDRGCGVSGCRDGYSWQAQTELKEPYSVMESVLVMWIL